MLYETWLWTNVSHLLGKYSSTANAFTSYLHACDVDSKQDMLEYLSDWIAWQFMIKKIIPGWDILITWKTPNGVLKSILCAASFYWGHKRRFYCGLFIASKWISLQRGVDCRWWDYRDVWAYDLIKKQKSEEFSRMRKVFISNCSMNESYFYGRKFN